MFAGPSAVGQIVIVTEQAKRIAPKLTTYLEEEA